MLSAMFRKDYDALTARGVKFALADVIRLNALALKAKDAAAPALGVPPRRVLFLDGWTLAEPTIAHEMWLEAVAPHFDLANPRMFAFVYAYALSREPHALPRPDRPAKCVRKVTAFARRRLLRMTTAALDEAIEYALFGADWTACEFAPDERRDGADGDAAPARKPSPIIGVLNGMRARRLCVSLDDAKRMTVTELCDLILRADARDGQRDAKAAHAEAVKEYYRALAEVRDARKGGE